MLYEKIHRCLTSPVKLSKTDAKILLLDFVFKIFNGMLIKGLNDLFQPNISKLNIVEQKIPRNFPSF